MAGIPRSIAPKSHDFGYRRSRLWLWVFAAFAVQLAAWTAWFVLASRHPVAEVPLAVAR